VAPLSSLPQRNLRKDTTERKERRSRVPYSIYEPLQPKGKSPGRLELHSNCFNFLFSLHLEVTLNNISQAKCIYSPAFWLKFLNPFEATLKLEYKEINLCLVYSGFHLQFITFHSSS